MTDCTTGLFVGIMSTGRLVFAAAMMAVAGTVSAEQPTTSQPATSPTNNSPIAVEESVDRSAPIVVSDEALQIHSAGYIWDGHNDLPWAVRQNGGSSFDRVDITKPQPEYMTDIPRLRTGNVGAQFWSVFVPVDTSLTGTALQTTIEQIALVREMCRRYPDVFAWAETIDQVDAARREGKIASLIGVEGGHSIENSLGNLRRLYDMGARYMTLTHSRSLDWADSATDDPKVNGLSPFGEEVIREMNRLGMLVDLSHVTPEVMRQALRITKAPVIFSHSSSRAVADHPRNVPDEILPLVRENGGVIMVNFYSGFVVPSEAGKSKLRGEYRLQLEKEGLDKEELTNRMARWDREHPQEPGTIHDVIDHIVHLVDHCGIDHVGIGADYDGVSMLPKQLEDVGTYPLITQLLLDRGYNEEQIHKIMYKNIHRVFKAAEAARSNR